MGNVISLFTGAGGLDHGFEAAGFETRVAVEMDADAVRSLRAQRPWPVIDEDIHRVESRRILDVSGLRVGEADVLIGGPPCQPFSKAGYWVSGDSRRLDDPRAGTLEAYFRVLEDTLPRAFLLENVPGLAYRDKSEGLDLVRRRLRRVKRRTGERYSMAVAKLNAADYGVPQRRERVFVVGYRDGDEFIFPRPTHGDPDRDDGPRNGLLPWACAWDGIGDLAEDDDPRLEILGKWAELLPSIPEGKNYLHHTERGAGRPLFGWRRRYWSFLLKLAKTRPSWTLQAQPGPAIGPFHWKNRRLSARELARLQTFPDDFRLLGNLRAAQKQAGNAVPSALAEALARRLAHDLLGRAAAGPLTLAPRPLRPVPEPERTPAVPERYLALVGDHAPHPGTGRGYGAERRRSVG